MAGKVTTGPDIPLTGRQLSRRYSLNDEMAPGALCRIIRGDDLVLRRPVVVKAIPPAQVEIYREALRATSGLTHPAAVALYDAIDEDGWLLLVQEAVPGQALSRYLRQGVPSERAVNLAIQLAQALAYAHHRDIIHGDLTPSAVLVDRQAAVRINNFGLPPDLDYFLTEGGAEVQGLIAEGTPYSDVLALGLLLRQMLSNGELAGTNPGERQVRSDVPDDLARLVARCTTPGASDAMTDAASLTFALEEIAAQLATTRQSLSSDTPAALRAARAAVADQATWASEPTVEQPQIPVPEIPLERGTHEVGSRFTKITHPGHSDGATTRPSDEEALAVPPRLRLPTRPLPEPMAYSQPGIGSERARRMAAGGGARGIALGGVLIIGMVLFIIFFLLGFLGPFALGGH